MQKCKAYFSIASRFTTARPGTIQKTCSALESRYGVDFLALGDSYALTPAMIAEMHGSGLVEFGAHGVSHASLGRLEAAESNWEICESKQQCEALVGEEIRHFAYPYGDSESAGVRELMFCREAGFQTAVTTESNTIFASDHERLLALPRLTFNGKFEKTALLDLLLSGMLPLLRRRGGFGRAEQSGGA